MFKKFDEKTIDEFMESIDRGINPFTDFAFSDRERVFVTEMMKAIYAAVHYDKDILFDPIKYNISVLDIDIEIKRDTSISQLSESIAEEIASHLTKNYKCFSQETIRSNFNKFLLKEGLIELRNHPYIEDAKSYFATKLGENCGLENRGQKSHNLRYSAYMQAYLLRKFPEIFIEEIKSVFKKDYVLLKNLVEPLTLEEQKIISDFRQLSPNCQKQVQNTIKAFLTSAGVAHSDNKNIS